MAASRRCTFPAIAPPGNGTVARQGRAGSAPGVHDCQQGGVVGDDAPEPQAARNIQVGAGKSFPLGATVGTGGRELQPVLAHAVGVELLLFDRAEDAQRRPLVPFDPAGHRTYHYWHAFVPGVRAGQLYGYRVDGPSEPGTGLRSTQTRLLLDPYGRAVAVPGTTPRRGRRGRATTPPPR